MEITLRDLLPFIGAIGGSFVGALTTIKLIVYRIKQLEKQVEKYNELFETVIEMKVKVETQSKDIGNIDYRVKLLEGVESRV